MKNTIIFAKYIVISALMLFVCIDNSSAAPTVDNCNASGSATFNFAVEQAIGITVSHQGLWQLEPICPGCFRKWNCEEGSYFFEFIITGSDECWWDWNSPESGRTNLIQTAGDLHATLEGCWYELVALPASDPTNWLSLYSTQAIGQPFISTTGGSGIGGLRYYITRQAADCNASGVYTWTVTVNANYVCSLVQKGA